MPTTTVFVAPELFFEHNGVKIYRTYRDDDVEQAPYTFRFTLDHTSDSPEWQFDVRDLDVPSLYTLKPRIPFIIARLWDEWHSTGRDNAIRQVLTEAIEQGKLRSPVPKESGQES